MKVLKILLLIVALTGAGLLVAARLDLLAGPPPRDTGLLAGRLRPPSMTPNSVSSQAALYPEHPQGSYAAMEPLRFQGDGAAAMLRLATVIAALDGTRIVEQKPGYLRAESTTRWLRFRDDLEFALDAPAGVIHFRSASRLGRKDFGTNRVRMETIRARFAAI